MAASTRRPVIEGVRRACSPRSRPRRNRTALLTAMDDRERLIALIYEGVIDGEAWQELLALLGYRLNAAGTGLGLQDMTTHEFRAVAEAGIDRGLHETYRRLAPENRIGQAIGRAGRPMADWMVVPKSELGASPLYSEWFAPQAFMASWPRRSWPATACRVSSPPSAARTAAISRRRTWISWPALRPISAASWGYASSERGLSPS